MGVSLTVKFIVNADKAQTIMQIVYSRKDRIKNGREKKMKAKRTNSENLMKNFAPFK